MDRDETETADAPDTSAVTVERRFAAPPERIFDAFLDPYVARHFLFATTTGEMIEATIDAKVGGRYVLTELRPTMGEVRHVGEYLRIDRPHRLDFTFATPQFGPSATLVSITIRPDRAGCVLTLTSDGASSRYAGRVREGWNRILDGLLPAYEGRHAAGWL